MRQQNGAVLHNMNVLNYRNEYLSQVKSVKSCIPSKILLLKF